MPPDSASRESAEPRKVEVPFERVPGWIERYDTRHPNTEWTIATSAVGGVSPDGSSVWFAVPLRPLDDPSLDGLSAHLARPWVLGVVIVRRGGFAVARVVGADVAEAKVGRRHVQGKTKAGGWSQQRFARRRDNQAKAAYDAASSYVHQILVPHASDLDLLVTAGDKAAVDTVFADRTLTPLSSVAHQWLPGIRDPKRPVLDRVITSVRSVTIEITDP